MRMSTSGVRSMAPAKPPTSLGGGREVGKSTMVPLVGNFHEGGKVNKTGAYQLEKGEKVVANKEVKKEGRNSEYRKVYLGRRKSKKS